MTNRLSLSAAVLLLAVGATLGTSLPAQAFSLSLGGSGSASGGGTSANGNTSASLGLDLGLSGSGSSSSSSSASTTAGATANPPGAVNASANFGVNTNVQTALSLIENSNWTTSTLSGTTSLTSEAILDVTPLLTSQTRVELNQALSANASNVSNLQTALSSNASISAWLQSQNVSASNVIAVGETADGSLTFFTLN